MLFSFACMSHEIRTPLNCIVGIASLMEDSDLKPCEQDNVNMIVGSGKLLRHIVDDVLDYSKLESGAMEVDIKPSNLQDVLVASVDSMTSSSITQKRNISIRTYYDPRLMSDFETDSRRLTQIFYNLLSNAVKFSKEDGVVEMSAKLIDPKYRNDAETHPDQVASKNILRLTVKDYGKGIDASDFESIFLPFSQTKTGINNTEGGTGLGLSITRKLVTGLGGYLSVNSQVGTFSEFTVDFPHPGDLPDLADFSRRLKQVSIVLIDENSLEVERVKDIFRTYDVAFSHFESHDDMRRDLVTSPGRVYICLVRCQLFDNEVLESVFRGARWEIITFGESSRLRKSSHHFRSVSAVFPYNFMKYVLDLAERLHRKPVVRLSRENEPTPDELVTIWKDLKVLVAEDNMVNQKVCRRLLNRIGVQDVVVVANGQEAVNIDARQPFDLILMDMQMPVMDGLEATKLIVARNGPHPVPKVVFLSAHVSDSFKDMCMESGAVGYVPKPCTLGSLKKILTEVVMMPPAESSAPVSSRRVRFGDIPVV
jgi:two-component system sensor histidine kinase/response regulator